MLYLYDKMLMLKTRVRNDVEGATAVEYGLMVAAIAALIIALVFTLGGYVIQAFTDTNTAWETGTP
jgi:pilus assembly protein Flp/PilA